VANIPKVIFKYILIGIITQNSFLLNDTIHYNLDFGEGWTDEEVLEVLDKVKMLYSEKIWLALGKRDELI